MHLDWWTLGLQTVNIAVLVWLLGRFFWRPVAAIIAERHDAAEKILTEAEKTREEARKELAEVAAARAAVAKERETLIAEAHETAKQEAQRVLDEARQEASSLRSAMRQQEEKERKTREAEWRRDAALLAVTIAGRLLSRMATPQIRQAFLDCLAEELRKLPEGQRQAINGAPLEAVSATPLPPLEEQQCRSRIAEVLNGASNITFKADPELLAGLELRGGNLVIANSWRADLDRIYRELANDG